MRKPFTLIGILLMALLPTLATAQVRGRGHIQGVISDKASGSPIANATITVALAGGNTAPIVVKSDSKGRWAALGLVSGQWNIDIAAPGYNTSRGTANVSEVQQLPMIHTEMTPEVKQEAAAVQSTPLVPKEAIDAIKEGQDLLKLDGSAQEKQDNAKKAVADFEKALPQIPTDKPELASVRTQLQEVMAQAYYKAGDLKNAIATLEKLNSSDPWTTPDANQTQRQVLLANLYLENNQLNEAKALIEKLPPSAITDSTVYINVGILFLNKKNPTDAVTYFSKAVTLNPKDVQGYYYRGLGEAQLKQTKEARADFEQVLVLIPKDIASETYIETKCKNTGEDETTCKSRLVNDAAAQLQLRKDSEQMLAGLPKK